MGAPDTVPNRISESQRVETIILEVLTHAEAALTLCVDHGIFPSSISRVRDGARTALSEVAAIRSKGEKQ